MTMLVRLTGGQWVDPEEIVAIEWNGHLMQECPRIILRNGHTMNATGFYKSMTTETAETVTERLLQHLSRKVTRGNVQCMHQVDWELARYSGADPAAPKG